MISTRGLSVMLALALAPSSASAAVIVANVEQTGGSVNHASPVVLSAANFISPSVPTTLTSVDLPLRTEPANATPTATLDLYSDVAGEPGVLLTSLGSHVLTGGANYSFTPDAPFALTPSTSYWLAFGCPDCSQTVGAGWNTGSAVPVVVGLPGADVPPDGAQSGDNGDTWTLDPFVGTLTFTVNGFVDIIAIPTLNEWGLALLILLVGLGGSLLLRR